MPERRGGPANGKKVPGQGTFKSRELLAQQFKVGKNAIEYAKALLSDAPDLVSQVQSCAASLDSAYEQLAGSGTISRKTTLQDAPRLAPTGWDDC